LPAPADDFVPFADSVKCPNYNDWPYGPQARTGYSAHLIDVQMKQRLAARPMTYLLGELDILPLAGVDASCPAMAQGPTRLARGLGKIAKPLRKMQLPDVSVSCVYIDTTC
jgi:hypothetical protein